MMKIDQMAMFLGCPISFLLGSHPFVQWGVEEEPDEELERVYYTFPANGMEVVCDSEKRVDTIFLFHEEQGGFDEMMIDFSFSTTRSQIIDLFGTPTKSGKPPIHPVLGKMDQWDRYTRPGYTIRFGYHESSLKIKEITLIRPDAVS